MSKVRGNENSKEMDERPPRFRTWNLVHPELKIGGILLETSQLIVDCRGEDIGQIFLLNL